jgi:hypothetical protein
MGETKTKRRDDLVSAGSFFRKNWFTILILFLLLINIGLGIYNLFFARKIRSKDIQGRGPVTLRQIQQESIAYDRLSPDFYRETFDGKKIRLSQFKGDTVILRFSRFYFDDLPYLLYLDHLAKRFEDKGVKLIFVNTLGKHDEKAINRIVTLSSPVIEDDGSISSLFEAKSGDVVLIDRDFRIKFKDSTYTYGNNLIYDLLLRYTFGEKVPPLSLPESEISALMKNLSYLDIRTNEVENLGYIIRDKRSILNLFISTCMACPEEKRLSTIKRVSERIGTQDGQIIILFGKGNGPKIVREYSERIALTVPNIIIGIIEEGSLPEKDYIRLFDFEINPRLFIFDKNGDIIFSENLKNKAKISAEYLLEKIR